MGSRGRAVRLHYGAFASEHTCTSMAKAAGECATEADLYAYAIS